MQLYIDRNRCSRAQQWAAAALTNFSQHGQRARAVLIRRGAVDAIAVALRQLTADANTDVLALEETAKQTEAEGQATKESGTAALSPGTTIEMLLGCLTNIAPHNPEELLEAGAIEAALQVLEKVTLHTPRGEHTHPMHEAAVALIRQTVEASMPEIRGGTGSIDPTPADSVAILASHEQLLPLSQRLAAIAKKRPESASVRELLFLSLVFPSFLPPSRPPLPPSHRSLRWCLSAGAQTPRTYRFDHCWRGH